MMHRHLNHQDYTLASIDDIIARGRRLDWVALRQALVKHPDLAGKVTQVCRRHLSDPYAQRYHFWNNHVVKHYAGTTAIT